MLCCMLLLTFGSWLSLCELCGAVKRTERAKSIDLNRTPSPEKSSSTDNRNSLSLRPEARNIVYKRKSKNDKGSPAYHAKRIAQASGHAKESKEYKSIYRKHIRKIRDEQRRELAKVSSAAKTDWEAILDQRRLYSKAYRDRIQHRKKLNISTPEDFTYFKHNLARQKKRFLRDPQSYRDRALEWYHKKAASKREAEKITKEPESDQDKQT